MPIIEEIIIDAKFLKIWLVNIHKKLIGVLRSASNPNLKYHAFCFIRYQ
jgi:hypothetical protein